MTNKEWGLQKVSENPIYGKVENGILVMWGDKPVDYINGVMYPPNNGWNVYPLMDGAEDQFWAKIREIIETTEQDALLKALEMGIK